jgi:hypothetical protein
MSISSVSASAVIPVLLSSNSAIPPGGQSNTAADAQNRVNALNQLIVNVSHLGWGGIAAKDGAAAVPIAQQELAQSIQLFESSEIGMATKEGLTGIDFDYKSVSFSTGQNGTGTTTQSATAVWQTSAALDKTPAAASSSSNEDIALSLLTASNDKSSSSRGGLFYNRQRIDLYT